MNARVLRVTNIDPEQASFSFGTQDNPVKETTLFVDIEFRGSPYELELTKQFEQGRTWEMNNVCWNGDCYSVNQMFSEQDSQFIYRHVMTIIYQKLRQVEEREQLIYTKPTQPTPQGKLQDPLVHRGMELTRKIAMKGGWRVGFDIKKETGEFVFLLVDHQVPQGTPAMVIGLHEIILKFDNNDDAFAEDAVGSFQLLLSKFT